MKDYCWVVHVVKALCCYGFFFLNQKERIAKEERRSGRKQKGGDDMGMMRGVGDKGLRLSRCTCTSAASYSCHPGPHSSSIPHLSIAVQVGMEMVQNPKRVFCYSYLWRRDTKPNCFKTTTRPSSKNLTMLCVASNEALWPNEPCSSYMQCNFFSEALSYVQLY